VKTKTNSTFLMAYQQFMYDEAFDFKSNQDVHQLKQQQQTVDQYLEDVHNVGDCSQQRLPPLGACSNEPTETAMSSSTALPEALDMNKFLALQDQYEQLNSSLFALTSHFAQVQFRMKQIINGPRDNQEKLMEELEEFAFAGCPDVTAPKEGNCCTSCVSHQAIKTYKERILEEEDREKRLDLHLKQMISDLEICQRQAEKQKETSKSTSKTGKLTGYNRLSNQLERLTKIEISDNESEEENESADVQTGDIKKYIDKTMARLVNPKLAKQSIISQVNKQITDMEKFVNFLNTYNSTTECEDDHSTTDNQQSNKNNSKNTSSIGKSSNARKSADGIPAPHTMRVNDEKRRRIHEASVAMMKKGLALLQIFAISQFGCSAKHFQEHMMRKKETATNSSTGHLKPLGQLKGSIDHIIAVHAKLVDVGGLHPDSEDEINLPISSADKRASWSRSKSRSRTESVTSSSVMSNSAAYKSIETSLQEELIRVVRGDFTVALKELMQHGLFESFTTKSLSTKALVGCMSSHTSQGHGMHIWELFDRFYSMKHGRQFSKQPSMMLSEAFAMDVGCTQQTPKQSLLTVLHRIKTTHETRKRSFDAMFKALISAGLNRGRLAQWIRLVIRMPELSEKHYERWSYVVRSGFDEVLTLLEKLSSLTFFLPEDLAIRHLLKNTNEFGDA